MKLAIGADHAGFHYKEEIKVYLENNGYELIDYGTNSPDSVDYPDFAHPVASAVESEDKDLGILICGSANGVAMTANKHQSIRAAICWTTELASLTKQHNNANIICIPARFISLELAKNIVIAFIKTNFEGGRHQRRVNKISC